MEKIKQGEKSLQKQQPTQKSSNGTGRARQSYDTKNVNDKGALSKLFHDMLKDAYWAEKHITQNLPDLIDAATSSELKDALTDHLHETEDQVTTLEEVFESIGKSPRAKRCDAMKGLVEEATEMVEETDDRTLTRDVGIIAACQKIEHYEIATYGTMASLAKTLGFTEAAKLLAQMLDEEKSADKKLTQMAEGQKINEDAAQEDS